MGGWFGLTTKVGRFQLSPRGWSLLFQSPARSGLLTAAEGMRRAFRDLFRRETDAPA